MTPVTGLIEGVVFDLDGTLADTLADIGQSLNAVLSARGLPSHSLDAYRTMIGEGAEVLIRRALPASEEGQVAEVLAAYRARYAEHLLDASVPYAGVPELLDGLTARGVKLGILSNKPDAPTQALARALFGRWPFLAVAGARPEVPRKPDPAGARAVLGALGLAAEACAFVGDTWVDIATARAAGMLAVGVAWGFRGAEEVEQAGADLVIAHPLALLEKLGPRLRSAA